MCINICVAFLAFCLPSFTAVLKLVSLSRTLPASKPHSSCEQEHAHRTPTPQPIKHEKTRLRRTRRREETDTEENREEDQIT